MTPSRRGPGFGKLLRMAICCLALLGPDGRAATATVDLAAEQQTIRGFGGATAFQPPGLPASLTNTELDTLFGNGPNQIGFTLLRIRLATDEVWRAVELGHALGARARGAEVIASPWSPPAAMKSNNSLIGGFLLPSAYADYATYLNAFAVYMADNGAPLYAISVQNEPDIEVDYESCDWTPAQMLEFCRNHAGAITATRLIAPESYQFRRNVSDPLLNDPTATENIEIIGGHIYGGGLNDYPLARSRGKEVWMTEHLELTTDWPGALATAKEIHDCLAVANFNAYLWWYLRRYYGPLGEDGVITKRGHVMAQFSKFVRPGYVRVSATANPTTGVHLSAYKGRDLVVVAINQSAVEVTQTISLEGGTMLSVTPWVTSETLSFAEQAPLPVTAGSFTATLPARSVTTFVGRRTLAAPTIVMPPVSRTVAAGDSAVLEVAASGEFLEYQWIRDGIAVPGANARLLTIRNAQPSEAGNYVVSMHNSAGAVTTAGVDLQVVVTPNPGRLVNISTRAPVGAGDQVEIAGFYVAGSAPKRVLIRAAGPALAETFGLQSVLSDPRLRVFDQRGNELAGNDDWDTALAGTFQAVGAFDWTAGSGDAAMVTTLNPGPYTVIVAGQDNPTAVDPKIALVEVYEVRSDGSPSRLVNISTRSLVGTGDSVQIGGFVLGGSTAKAVVIRAAGPALNASFGLNGVLADPVLTLHRQPTGAVVAVADGWEPAWADSFSAVGAFPWSPGSKDAALVTMLEPGAYTVIVRGQDGGTGLALVEIYEIP